MHELLSLRRELWKFFSIFRDTDVDLSQVRFKLCEGERGRTNHRGIEFVQIPPALSLRLHDIDLLIHKWPLVPNCR